MLDLVVVVENAGNAPEAARTLTILSSPDGATETLEVPALAPGERAWFETSVVAAGDAEGDRRQVDVVLPPAPGQRGNRLDTTRRSSTATTSSGTGRA